MVILHPGATFGNLETRLVFATGDSGCVLLASSGHSTKLKMALHNEESSCPKPQATLIKFLNKTGEVSQFTKQVLTTEGVTKTLLT